MSESNEDQPSVPALAAVCDRCEQAFDRAGALLEKGVVAEALRVLQRNEAVLQRAVRALGDAPPPRGADSGGPPFPEAAVAAPAGGSYAPVGVELARLKLLGGRVERLLDLCAAMQDRTWAELRLLGASRGFRPAPETAGGWLSVEA